MVAVFGSRDCLGDVGVSVALSPFGVDVQFHLPRPLVYQLAYTLITKSVTACNQEYICQMTHYPQGVAHLQRVAMMLTQAGWLRGMLDLKGSTIFVHGPS